MISAPKESDPLKATNNSCTSDMQHDTFLKTAGYGIFTVLHSFI
jgi:hypothetical protein